MVKAAAAAAAKNKAGSKPRTSANSNKDKEDRKWLKVPSKKEETSTSTIMQEVQKKEEEPTSSDTFGKSTSYKYKIVFFCSVKLLLLILQLTNNNISRGKCHIYCYDNFLIHNDNWFRNYFY